MCTETQTIVTPTINYGTAITSGHCPPDLARIEEGSWWQLRNHRENMAELILEENNEHVRVKLGL